MYMDAPAPVLPGPPSSRIQPALAGLRTAVLGVFRGRAQVADQLLTAFLAGGHVLLEDIPGVGKTTLARALAAAIGGRFQRLQCTPDLMPSDVTGVSIYDERERCFRFHPGPVFGDVLLADELNRTPPRTQAALLEALSEGQVTVDGAARPLAATFFCIATQNPLDQAGTYPLPDSQKDRFLLAFGLGYPERAAEADLLEHDGAEADLRRVGAVTDLASIAALREAVRQVRLVPAVRGYLLDLLTATRSSKALMVGASPRAGLGLQRACQARALLAGRAFVIPEDVQQLAAPALGHRVVPRVGQDARQVVQGLVEALAVPR